MGNFERSGGMMSPTPNDYGRINFSDTPKTEYGQVNPADTYPALPSELVPSEGDPKQAQVSSNKASTPEAMASETDDSQNAFAELQQFLNNSLETPGARVCHPLDRPWTPPHGSGGKGESY
jgi:hypothetical protein